MCCFGVFCWLSCKVPVPFTSLVTIAVFPTAACPTRTSFRSALRPPSSMLSVHYLAHFTRRSLLYRMRHPGSQVFFVFFCFFLTTNWSRDLKRSPLTGWGSLGFYFIGLLPRDWQSNVWLLKTWNLSEDAFRHLAANLSMGRYNMTRPMI